MGSVHTTKLNDSPPFYHISLVQIHSDRQRQARESLKLRNIDGHAVLSALGAIVTPPGFSAKPAPSADGGVDDVAGGIADSSRDHPQHQGEGSGQESVHS